ncbi:MAG: lipid-binding protein [Prolixibacteraceae bacterium]
MKKQIIILFALFGLFFSSCDKKAEYIEIDSQVVEAAGEWWIKFSKTGYETGYIKVLTFNTAADLATEMWISDNGKWKGIKFKCPVDIPTLSFGGNNLPNTNSANTVTVQNGKITKNGGSSTSGVVTDKIYFELELSSEPGVLYKAEGTRKTGFVEDEH